MRLSVGQEALYFEHQANPLSFGLNESAFFIVRSEINLPAFRRSLQRLVDRYELFRTRFQQTETGVDAIVFDQVAVDFQIIDAAGWNPSQLNDAMAAFQNRQLDLSQDPLFSVALWSLSPTDHRMIFRYHHITVDGWSYWIIFNELRALYAAECAGRDCPLPPTGGAYADYAQDQREFLQGPKIERLEKYWQKKLEGAPTLLNLPVDFVRPPHTDQHGESIGFTLPTALYQKLRALATSRRASLYTLLTAAFQTLLYRYTGQDDFVISSPVPGRNDARWERTIGYFVNQIVLRAQLTPELTFEDFWAQTRTNIFGAFKHAAIPFPLVARQLVSDHTMERPPVAQVAFVFQKSQEVATDVAALFECDLDNDPPLDLGGLRLFPQHPPGKPTQSEITLAVAELERPGMEPRLSGTFYYQTALFAPETIRRMVAQFEQLLHSIVENPGARVASLNLLPAAERAELLAWSAAPADYPHDATLADLFWQEAARHPDAIALSNGDAKWSYGTLRAHAADYAEHLLTAGSAMEEPVVVMAERSFETMAAFLGIVRAGAAYVPIDPAYPVEQVELMLEESRARILFLQPTLFTKRPELIQLLESRPGCRILPLESTPATTARHWPRLHPDQLAYLIFTSGTTGRPKGVAVTHRNVVRLVRNTNFLTVQPDDVFLQLATLSFDAATFEIWMSLLNGARLVVPPAEPPTLADISRIIAHEGVTAHFITTGLFHQIVSENPEALAPLRLILTGGSVINPELVRRLFEKLPSHRLHNMYGPTENTTFSTFHPLTPPGNESTLPIGRTIANSTAYVLDDNGQLAPVSVPGELYVGGDGLARGYLHNADMTAARFVPDSISGTPGARLYRTGDQARYRFDGTIEFLGRRDQQVKIRGFRIELEGIEHTLRQLPNVLEALVISTKLSAGQNGLVAYVVPKIPESAQPELWREMLAQKLPAFMVPAAVVALDRFPLKPNGKVNLSALPAPLTTHAEENPAATPVNPRTEDERTLAAIWCRALSLPQVSVQDDFFSLGGDSILVLSVIAQAQNAGLKIAVRDVLERRTIAAICAPKSGTPKEVSTLTETATPLLPHKAVGRLPKTESEKKLASIWAEALHLESVGIDENFFGLGGDSILSLSVIARAQQVGLLFSIRDVLEKPTIAELCDKIDSTLGNASLLFKDEAGPVHLTPTQQWFFEAYPDAPSHWNMGCRWRLTRPVGAEIIQKIFHAITAHHNAFHLRFQQQSGKWTAVYEPDRVFAEWTRVDLSGLDETTRVARIEAAEVEAHRSLRLDGPLARLVYFDEGPQRPGALAWALHHLIIDGVSWRVLFEDWSRALSQSLSGVEISLLPASTSMGRWSEHLQAWGAALPRSHGSDVASFIPLPQDSPCAAPLNSMKHAALCEAQLSPEVTEALLRQLPAATGTRVLDVLASALCEVISTRYERDGIWLNLEGHGRESFEGSPAINRTVGWFTSFSPVFLERSAAADTPAEHWQYTQSLLRSSARKSFEQTARHFSSGQSVSPQPQPEISLNYLGQWKTSGEHEKWLTWEELSLEKAFDPESPRTHWWDVAAWVREGKLELRWAYCRDAHREETISALMRELVRRLESAAAWSRTHSADHSLVPTKTSHPLSFQQEQLWFIYQFDPSNAAYNVPLILRMQGNLNHSALTRAIREIGRRHEVLRGRFVQDGDSTRQVIEADALPMLEVVSLQPGTPEQRRAEALERIYSIASHAFDLTRPPLMETLLFEVAPDDHLLFLQIHHIASDGWSAGIFQRELAALYSDFITGKPASLPELPLQYGDYARWQREHLSGPHLQELNAFWKQYLNNVPTTELPWDFARPPVQTFAGAVHRFPIPAQVIQTFRAWSREENASLFMVLMASFVALLYRSTGQEDIVLGSPYANREKTNTEKLIGCFVNMVPMRTQLRGTMSFRELIRTVRQSTTEAFIHQELPFEKLVRHLNLPRDASRNPLVQIVFALQNAFGEMSSWPKLNVSFSEFPVRATRVDFECHVIEAGDAADVHFVYNTALFKPETIERLARHWQILLESLITHPSQPIDQLALMDADAHRRILSFSTGPSATEQHPDTLAALFEKALYEHGDRAAVEFHGQSLTHCELHAIANRMARLLQRDYDVRPEQRVGVLMDRSISSVIAFLAITKAGGVYVPLDPDYPSERLQFLAQDAQLSLILTDHPELAASCAGKVATIEWGEAESRATALSADSFPCPASSTHAAYMIYTSGTTGRPKGVVIPHAAIVNTITALRQAYHFNSTTRIVHLSSLSFDASLVELAGSLAAGATLVIGRKEEIAPGVPLSHFLREKRITHLPAPPSALSFLTDESLPELRVIIAAGEALPQALAERWRQGRILINGYGPTETAICATVAEEWGDGVPPIGKPITGSCLFVLDESLSLTPIGVSGEVYIGGAGVARGYWNRPELTAERFVPNPFSHQPSERLYRTGDRARWREDGQLEFLGRADEQIKLRGIRIEPGEIESALISLPGILEAAIVFVPGDNLGSLAAFAVPETGSQLDASTLLQTLRDILPAHLVPNIIHSIDVLPRTANGKIDRRQLVSQAASRATHQPFVEPQTEMEKRIAAIWENVLDVDRVGRDDSFFALGGHSLLATRVLAALQESVPIDMGSALRSFFLCPILREFAAALEADTNSNSVSIPADLTRTRAPLSFAQQRLWFLHQLYPDDISYNVPITFQLRGTVSDEAVRWALQAMLDRHSILRTRFCKSGEKVWQEIAPAAEISLRLLAFAKNGFTDPEAWAAHHSAEFIREPFDLQSGPVMKALFLRLGEGEYRLICNLHHIVFDGWSAPIFIRELLENIDRKVGLASVQRPPLPLQYADFAQWERSPEQEPRWLRTLDYWSERLRDLPVLELPLDHPRTTSRTGAAGRHYFQLPLPVVRTIEKLARSQDATAYMAFLAAFQFLMSRWSGQDDFAVGTAVANRNQKELQNLVGFFVNSLVLRADVSGNPDFLSLLQRVRATARDAFAHQEMPFDHLVEKLQPERQLHNPLFQIACVLQQEQRLHYALDHFQAELVASEVPLARLDIELHLFEHENAFSGLLVYDGTLFEAASIERLINQYVRLLQQISEQPQRPLKEFSLTAPTADTASAAQRWNQSKNSRTIIERLTQTVAAHPDHTALESDNQSVTYAQFEAWTNQLTRTLQRRGIKPHSTVGIMMDRGIEAIVALVAIMKAGATYVPLDRDYPPERIAFLIEDAAIPVVITTGLSVPAGAQVVEWLDWKELNSRCAEELTDPLLRSIAPAQIAYIIYTSGSTGQPKGVAVSHEALSSSIHSLMETFQMSPESAFAQNASLNFDASILEIFCALASGARLLLPDKAAQMPGLALSHFLQRHGATHLTITPTALAAMPENSFTGLTTLIIGGEVLPIHLAQKWSAPQRRLCNGYGPTEAAICVLTSSRWSTEEKPPIGLPVRYADIHILDRDLCPVPPGGRGEICIGGPMLAHGYLNRPDQTAVTFVPDPFSSVPGARLYRTGDLGRLRPDGQIDFLGRADGQVKVRGFRIELGEIESVLRTFPGVKDALALTRRNARDEEEIAAFVTVPASNAGLEIELVSQWRQLYDDVMDTATTAADASFDIAGWNSSYTGQPLPAEEMRLWRDALTRQLLEFPARSVLEIGCGTGLMLLPVAPDKERYWGIDFSAASLRRLQQTIDARKLNQITLFNRRADELPDLPPAQFDLALTNSVIQYFPGSDYLLGVITDTLERLPDGAHFFIGDVRNLALLPVQHTSVEFERADDSLTAQELADLVKLRLNNETELNFSPYWFWSLPERLPRIRGVEIRWRTTPAPNELSKFRYDVVLHIGDPASPCMRKHGVTSDFSPAVAQALARDLDIHTWMLQGGTETVGSLRQQLRSRALNESDLAFISDLDAASSTRPLHNNPVRSQSGQQTLATLRRHLEAQLPLHMIPGSLAVLDQFPLTPNGKVDRARLRSLDTDQRNTAGGEPPQTVTEKLVAHVWAEFLRIEHISRQDNFFALGGHSLLATRVIARLQESLPVDSAALLRLFFSRPTLAAFAAALETETTIACGIRPAAPQADYPLSYAQQRLWFIEKMFPGQAAYHSPFGLRFNGHMEADWVRRAFQSILDRHSALRTVFAQRGEQPVQIVSASAAIPFSTAHWPGSGDPERWAQERADAFIRTPFDFSHDPLVKVLWLQLNENDHVLLVSIHHIAFDGWSAPILLRELIENLDAERRGVAVTRPPLPIEYKDYAVWERSPEQESRWLASLGHWRQELDGYDALQLPTEGLPSGEAERQEIVLSASVSKALRELGQREGASLFMTLLAGFEAVLAHWSGQERFVVGTGVANRNQKELHDLVGFFVNSLALPADLSGTPSFLELLRRTREKVSAAFAHQELPFERLVQELQPERSLRNPIFQVAFLLQEVQPQDFTHDSLAMKPFPLDWTTNRMELEVHLHETSDGIRGVLYYDRALFSAATIERLIGQFNRMLEQAVAQPASPLAELEWIDAPEQQRLIEQWSRHTAEPASPAKTILGVLADTVLHHPDAVAIAHGERSLTYTQLDALSNRLARHLATCGVGRESRVALRMGRRPETIAAMLAVLKAGGAYIPLDPDHPKERLQWILADAQPVLTITDTASDDDNERTVSWTALLAASIPCAASAVPQRAGSGNLAYLIYTSGSTGVPKGVEVTHGNLGHAAAALAHAYAVTAESSVLQLATLTFDASVAEIYMAFAAGARLVLPEQREELAGEPLARLARREHITHLQITPSALALLPSITWPELEALIVVGEAFPKELAGKWNTIPQRINGYGPTEGTICATCSVNWPEQTAPPIGRPIPRVRTYLLDAELRPVPIGTPGELYIGGSGVARGYWNRPDLTASRFIPDPFSDELGARLYQTGDRARWREDGQLEFLGRADDQIKIRGQRIEPGEIAAMLNAHPDVREAVVRADTSGHEPVLVAYVVAENSGEDTGRGQVGDWRRLYDQMMTQATPSTEPESDFAGWNSIYTAQPIPLETMRAWQRNLNDQILALKPRRVLEIGCGSGLMLLPVAPHCESYWGADFSQATLDRLQNAVDRRQLKQVRLWLREADQWDDFPDSSFDTIVLNSVIQYFPAQSYLERVLSEAVRATAPGGHLFIGDVRSLELQEVLYTSSELARAIDSLPREEFHRRVDAAMEREEELTVSPAFFRSLPQRYPQISAVEIRWRSGEPNELSLFRYDVVLHLGSTSETPRGWSPTIEQELIRLDATARWARGESDLKSGVSTIGEWKRERMPLHFTTERRNELTALSIRDDAPRCNRPWERPFREHFAMELRDYLRSELPSAMVPAHIIVLDHMPLSPSGKLDVRALPPVTSSETRTGAVATQPRTPMEDLVAAVYCELLNVNAVDTRANFFELGGHSLLAYRLIETLRQRTGRQLALANFFAGPTVERVAANLLQQKREAIWSPLVSIQTLGHKTPFFCAAPILGTTFPYFELARELGTDQPFYGLQPRGLDGHETPHTSIPEIAADFVEAVRSVQPHGPYQLGGWSFGAPVAFEMARILEQSGEKVSIVVSLDGALEPNRGANTVFSLKQIVPMLTAVISQTIPYLADYFSLLIQSARSRKSANPEQTSGSFLSDLFSKAAGARVVPKESRLLLVDQPLLPGMLKVFRANLQAMRTYHAQPIQSPLVLFFGLNGLAGKLSLSTWQNMTSGSVREIPVSGEHMTILRAPHVKEIAERLRECLDP